MTNSGPLRGDSAYSGNMVGKKVVVTGGPVPGGSKGGGGGGIIEGRVRSGERRGGVSDN